MLMRCKGCVTIERCATQCGDAIERIARDALYADAEGLPRNEVREEHFATPSAWTAREHAQEITLGTVCASKMNAFTERPQQGTVSMRHFDTVQPRTNLDTAQKAQRSVGPGGAPNRCVILPDAALERKKYPIQSGVMDYFPDAIAAVAHVSWNGNEQHNPGQKLHWARGKSMDQLDTAQRHISQRGTLDTDGQRHLAKAAWRVLAALQLEIENEQS